MVPMCCKNQGKNNNDWSSPYPNIQLKAGKASKPRNQDNAARVREKEGGNEGIIVVQVKSSRH
jgi:hypothetical protein